MSRTYRRRRRSSCLSVLASMLMTVIVLLVILLAVFVFLGPKIKKLLASYIADKAIDTVLEQTIDSYPELQEVIEQIPAEDRDTVTQIIENNLTPETAMEITQYAENGDIDGAIQYAQEHLSEEEFNRLYQIYETYTVE